MTKRIKYVPDVHVTNDGGQPMQQIPGTGTLTVLEVVNITRGHEVIEQKVAPFKLRQVVFFFERVADEAYTNGQPDVIGNEIERADIRGFIKRQEKEAEARGYWEFDDAVWLKLLAASTKPKAPINAALPGIPAVNYVPFILAVRDASTVMPEIELPNGSAAAQALM